MKMNKKWEEKKMCKYSMTKLPLNEKNVIGQKKKFLLKIFMFWICQTPKYKRLTLTQIHFIWSKL